MFVVRGTKKFRDRVRGPASRSDVDPTTLLGDWYATVLFWRPQVALFVDERTLLPVLVPFAPASTLLSRFPRALGQVLSAHGTPQRFVAGELAEMSEHRLEPTTNRSVIGMMNEFSYLASRYTAATESLDLIELALRLSRTPCGPLHSRHTFPDCELAALVSGDGQTAGLALTAGAGPRQNDAPIDDADHARISVLRLRDDAPAE